jgi:hypothetical protein
VHPLRNPNERLSTPRHADYGVTGDERLSANDKADDHGSPKGPGERERDSGGKRRRSAPAGELSKALRSVYDNTVREDIPDDFLDLLGKLS